MESKLGALAARLKKGIEAEQERRLEEERARAEAEERAARARDEGQSARKALLDELFAFGNAVGHLDVRREKGSLVLGYDGRAVVLIPEGDLDRIDLRLPDDHEPRRHHLTRDEDGEWELAIDEGEHLRRLPLELGLEELMRVALRVPLEGRPPPPPGAPPPAPPPPPPPVERPAPRARRQDTAPPGSKITDLKGPLD